jgi:hypothetical protein
MLFLGDRYRSIGTGEPGYGWRAVSCELPPSLNSEILAGYHSKEGFPTYQTGGSFPGTFILVLSLPPIHRE